MFAGVGERTREGNDLYREMQESVSANVEFSMAAWADALVRVQTGSHQDG